MSYIYHYHASYQKNYDIVLMDGIIQTEDRIDSMDRIKEVKKSIDKDNAYRLTIKSLSLLHTTEE